ncbi:MAG TPA: patatin-like phospholipase family protein [Burkholderiaceae bacterium]|nr:patatin-like phospholipase family protein [Burkholderiaceae bacterium]
MRKLPYDCVALVLQGGGALGSYQAGVVEGLDEAGIHPDWVAGISIGALNTAIVAGNPPGRRAERLRAFWDEICQPAYFAPLPDALQAFVGRTDGDVRRAFSALDAWRALFEGQRGFFVPRVPPATWVQHADPTTTSFYDTSPLKATLERHADFDRINSGEVRVSVGAVNIRTGNFEYFDNTGERRGRLRPEHFMASGSLPPGFPATEIDGEFYWDGGLVSNTPLAEVLQASPRRDTLVFQVDLWSARGHLPSDLASVQTRQKDIQFSSRTRMVTDAMKTMQRHRRMLREVLQHVPEAVRAKDPWCQAAARVACEHHYNVIHLIYRDKDYEGHYKDYEFGPATMRMHWATGLDDVRRTLAHADWLELPPDGAEFVTHDIHR